MLKCECVSNEHNHGIGNSNCCNRSAIYRVYVRRNNPLPVSDSFEIWSVCQECLRETDVVVAVLKTKRKDA